MRRKEQPLILKGGIEELRMCLGIIQIKEEITTFTLVDIVDLPIAQNILKDAHVPYDIVHKDRSIEIIIKPLHREVEVDNEQDIFFIDDEIEVAEPYVPMVVHRTTPCIRKSKYTPEERKLKRLETNRKWAEKNKEKRQAYQAKYQPQHRAKKKKKVKL